MKHTHKQGMLIAAIVMGCIPLVQAAEPSSKTPTTPASSVPTTIMQTFMKEGSITALDVTSAAPSVQVADKDGKVWTLSIDPLVTTVWKQGIPAKADALKIGDHVKVRYTEKSGKAVAKSIQLIPAPTTSAAPSSTSEPATSY